MGNHQNNIGIRAAKYLYMAAAFILSIFALYSATFGARVDVVQRGTTLMLVMIIVYGKNLAKETTPLWDRILSIIFLAGGVAALAHQLINFEALANNLGVITMTELILGILLIVSLLDCTRRTIGWPIVIIALIFMAYAYFGGLIPPPLGHRGYTVTRIVTHLYIGTNGLFGTPLGTASTVVIMFILFGAFLEASGGGKFFMDIAIALTGRTRGGPAKAAVLSSALMGTISGNAASNVVTTGTFTIPLMKETGYKPHVAGAIEAVASTGGQIMPPVMGAAAFIMGEMIGVPYKTIALAAVIPSVLYFGSVFAMVHFEAVKCDIRGLKDDIPDLRSTWGQNWHTLLSVVVLVGTLAAGFSAMRSALYGVIAAIVCSYFRKHTRMTPKTIFQTLISAGEGIVTVAIACACAGIVIGSISLTGLGLKISSLIMTLSAGHLILALIFTLIALIILGMGMPTAAAYIMVATLVAPGLIDFGLLPLQAHMFCLYGAVLSAITPPVALAAYAAAGIAKANPMDIGVTACRFGIVAFIIPFFFAYEPALLFVGSGGEIALAFVSATIGVIGLSAGVQGCFIRKMPLVLRIVLIIGSLLLIYPGATTDIVGLVVVCVILVPQIVKSKQSIPG